MKNIEKPKVQRFDESKLQTPDPTLNILVEAHNVIYGDREQTYGSPDKNLKNIANFWSCFLHAKYGNNINLDISDVCQMMILVKQARLINQPTHLDSQIDICGYTALLNRCQNEVK